MGVIPEHAVAAKNEAAVATEPVDRRPFRHIFQIGIGDEIIPKCLQFGKRIGLRIGERREIFGSDDGAALASEAGGDGRGVAAGGEIDFHGRPLLAPRVEQQGARSTERLLAGRNGRLAGVFAAEPGRTAVEGTGLAVLAPGDADAIRAYSGAAVAHVTGAAGLTERLVGEFFALPFVARERREAFYPAARLAELRVGDAHVGSAAVAIGADLAGGGAGTFALPMKQLFFPLFAVITLAACSATKPPASVASGTDPCATSALEPDFRVLSPWGGAGLVDGKVPPGNYVVAATRIPSQESAAAEQRFREEMLGIMPMLDRAPGLVAYQTGASDRCRVARTISVWRDDESRRTFVGAGAHGEAVIHRDAVSRGGETSVHWTEEGVANITWENAAAHLLATANSEGGGGALQSHDRNAN